jgi:hypothetical protein
MFVSVKQGGQQVPFKRSKLEMVAAIIVLAVLGFLLALAISPRPGETVAHLYGRALGRGHESACPTSFGNAFWFACASETRRSA